MWFKFRQGRITTSIIKETVCKVSDDQKILNPLKLKTITKKVCEPKESDFKSKATEWGITNEPIGRKMYIQLMKNKHKVLHVTKTGFFTSVDYPFIGASPDGIIQCGCHDERLLEIKCPFTYRGLSIKGYAAKTDGCLEIVDNHIQLKRTHSFFFQVQCQMGVTGKRWYDFFICTIQGSFSETINFDEQFWNLSVTKACTFYHNIMLKRLFMRYIRKESESALFSVLDMLQ